MLQRIVGGCKSLIPKLFSLLRLDGHEREGTGLLRGAFAEPFRVIYEAAGMNGDFQTYLIRSLLSEGRLRYEVVEKTSEGLKPRLIEREGPTGLLVTTTAVKLHPENETRLLSLTVTDTHQQTRDVLAALARWAGGEYPNLGAWHALQELLYL